MNPPDPVTVPIVDTAGSGSESRGCANCGHDVVGDYCAACGQQVAPFLRPIHHLGREVMADYFGFDGKLWRTIVPLLFRPGLLTREYLEGRRNRYVRPVRLYLTASVLLFFLISIFPDGSSIRGLFEIEHDRVAGGAASLDGEAEALVEVEAEIVALDSTRARLVLERDSLRQGLLVGTSATVADEIASADSVGERGFWDGFGEAMGRKGERVGEMGEEGAKQWFVDAFTSNMPKAMFVLLPLFALLLKLLFVRHRRYYGEHLVFALHIHAFSFVVFTCLTALQAATGTTEQLTGSLRWLVGGSVLMLVAWAPAYVLVALKRVYEQGWIKTTLKWAALMATYFVALTLAVVGVVVLAFLLL